MLSHGIAASAVVCYNVTLTLTRASSFSDLQQPVMPQANAGMNLMGMQGMAGMPGMPGMPGMQGMTGMAGMGMGMNPAMVQALMGNPILAQTFMSNPAAAVQMMTQQQQHFMVMHNIFIIQQSTQSLFDEQIPALIK